jgi:riboflavin-specific deaminase-like protein
VVGHLGQSIDGHIATEAGDSIHVTGRENIEHLHRMRALADVILVGARTVESDDPRLTTRLVEGSSPTRVIVDPNLRLGGDYGVFRDDAAPTIVACAQRALTARENDYGQAELLAVTHEGDWLNLASLLDALRARGFFRIFVEGGGITVSSFLRHALLDRLQVAIAPLVIGSGRPGLRLPAVESLTQSLRPQSRTYRMGEDVMFDLALVPERQIKQRSGTIGRYVIN